MYKIANLPFISWSTALGYNILYLFSRIDILNKNINPDLLQTLGCLNTGSRADGSLQTLQYAGCSGSCIIYASGITHLPYKQIYPFRTISWQVVLSLRLRQRSWIPTNLCCNCQLEFITITTLYTKYQNLQSII